jgi:transcriptional regulator with XRE-family HTH domain
MRVITANAVAVKSAAVEFLRAKLNDTGMSQTELAKLAGFERSHFRRYWLADSHDSAWVG